MRFLGGVDRSPTTALIALGLHNDLTSEAGLYR